MSLTLEITIKGDDIKMKAKPSIMKAKEDDLVMNKEHALKDSEGNDQKRKMTVNSEGKMEVHITYDKKEKSSIRTWTLSEDKKTLSIEIKGTHDASKSMKQIYSRLK